MLKKGFMDVQVVLKVFHLTERQPHILLFESKDSKVKCSAPAVTLRFTTEPLCRKPLKKKNRDFFGESNFFWF